MFLNTEIIGAAFTLLLLPVNQADHRASETKINPDLHAALLHIHKAKVVMDPTFASLLPFKLPS